MERRLQALLVSLADARLVRSAHDVSDGGLAVTLAECCFDTNGMGAEVTLDGAHSTAATLFGESASCVLVSVSPDDVTPVLEQAAAAGVNAKMIGQTGGNRIRIAVAGSMALDVAVDEAERRWSSAIARYFARRVA